jgi:hypothetical protein
MAYADAIRNGTANFSTVASLVEGACPDVGFANYTTIQSMASSTLQDVTGSSVTVTIATGDSVLLLADYSFSGSVVGDDMNITFRQDSTDVGVVTREYIAVSSTTGERQRGFLSWFIASPTVGSRTYKLRYARQSGGSTTIYIKNVSVTALVFQNR